jgi:hypothetical protein
MHRLKTFSSCFLCFALFCTLSGVDTRADVIVDFKQQSGLDEDFGIRRAVYLGRMFSGVTGGSFRRMDAMHAVITIAQATQSANVQLFAGDGSSNFDTAFAQGRMTDTGIRVVNRTQNNTEVLRIPGDPSDTPAFKIENSAGVAIHETLAAKNYLEFWVVGNSGSGFTVPSVVGAGNANFLMRFERSTAVPEPSSILLASAGLGLLSYRLRRSRRV